MTDTRDLLFRYRSYTPIPFLVVGLLIGRPTVLSLVIGLGIALAGEAIRMWGVGHATSETRVTGGVGASRLVTSGPFAHVRNPLYLGNLLLYSGFGVMANVPWLVLATLAWFIFQYTMIVSREEEFLSGKFGEDYARYRSAVRRFIPRLVPYAREADTRIVWEIALSSERRTLQALAISTALMIGRWLMVS